MDREREEMTISDIYTHDYVAISRLAFILCIANLVWSHFFFKIMLLAGVMGW